MNLISALENKDYKDEDEVFINGNKTVKLFELKNFTHELKKNVSKNWKVVAVFQTDDLLDLMSIYSVFHLGFTLLPLSLSAPTQTIKETIERCDPDAIIIPTEYLRNIEIVKNPKSKILHSDKLKNEAAVNSNLSQIKTECKTNIAYLINSSGTTGQSKTIQIRKSAVKNLIENCTKKHKCLSNSPARIIGVSDITFDLFILDFFLTLYTRGQYFQLPKPISANLIVRKLILNRINLLQSTPTILNWLNKSLNKLNFKKSYLELIISTGEVIDYNLCKALFENFKCPTIWNMYGPSETIHASIFEIKKDWINEMLNTLEIPIGKPIDNIYFEIHNKNNFGVGELIISGPHLSSKYFKPVKNSGYFKDKKKGLTSYRTNDLAEKTKEGHYIFRGRKDDLVKVNGILISLSHVTNLIKKQFEIREAILLNHSNNLFLFSSKKINKSDINSHLRIMGLECKIVSVLTILEWPKNQNGKLDINNLKQRIIKGIDFSSEQKYFLYSTFEEHPQINIRLSSEINFDIFKFNLTSRINAISRFNYGLEDGKVIGIYNLDEDKLFETIDKQTIECSEEIFEFSKLKFNFSFIKCRLLRSPKESLLLIKLHHSIMGGYQFSSIVLPLLLTEISKHKKSILIGKPKFSLKNKAIAYFNFFSNTLLKGKNPNQYAFEKIISFLRQNNEIQQYRLKLYISRKHKNIPEIIYQDIDLRRHFDGKHKMFSGSADMSVDYPIIEWNYYSFNFESKQKYYEIIPFDLYEWTPELNQKSHLNILITSFNDRTNILIRKQRKLNPLDFSKLSL